MSFFHHNSFNPCLSTYSEETKYNTKKELVNIHGSQSILKLYLQVTIIFHFIILLVF